MPDVFRAATKCFVFAAATLVAYNPHVEICNPTRQGLILLLNGVLFHNDRIAPKHHCGGTLLLHYLRHLGRQAQKACLPSQIVALAAQASLTNEIR
jgi:hypothetical protein